LLKSESRRDPDLAMDPTVVTTLRSLKQQHRGQVTYTKVDKAPEPVAAPPAELDLLVVPAIGPAPMAQANQPVVFALARGILYAPDAATGDLRWATRAGIDTSRLPLRLPGTADRVLVVSSDSNLLSAREANTGKLLWHHRLPAPCLGQPVLVDRRVLVPTYDGLVEDLDVATGK